MEKAQLKSRRESLGINQTEFAKLIGVTTVSVSRWETGSVDFPKWLDLVLEALEVRKIKELQKQIEG